MAPSDLVRQFLQNRDAILAFVFALTRSRPIAEEVFQEVALAILDEAQQGRQVISFLAWAREIARRRVAAYFRVHGQNKKLLPLPDTLADMIDLAFRENEREQEQCQLRLELLHRCMEQLAGRGRQVIEEKYQNGKPIAAIAENLGWKPESVKVALSRARKQLGDCVQLKLRLQEAGLP
jgi:RNA polymerase sigma-70 factor (ECF subfamily)